MAGRGQGDASLVPFLDIEDVSRFEPLQDELQLTMADFTRLMSVVTEQTGVVVPKHEYPFVRTLDGLEHYSRIAASFRRQRDRPAEQLHGFSSAIRNRLIR